MLRTTDKSTGNELQNTQAENQDALGAAGRAGNGGVGRSFENLSTAVKSAKSKKPKLTKSKKSDLSKANSRTDFLTPEAKEAFIHLQKAFTKALILRYFDPECHIRIKTDALRYAIGGVLSQITSDQHYSNHMTHEDLISSKSEIGQWYPVAFFSWKMISIETWYKTHDQELLDMVEVFKTWRHYLEGCKYEILVLTNYNNLWRFMDTKSLSFRQVRWAQELSRYHFYINYCQGKANIVADTLSHFPQRKVVFFLLIT